MKQDERARLAAQIEREMILDSDAPEWAPLAWDKWDEDEDEDGDIIEYGAAHVHCWSNATGVLGERWCLDCDWLLMPDGTLIQ